MLQSLLGWMKVVLGKFKKLKNLMGIFKLAGCCSQMQDKE